MKFTVTMKDPDGFSHCIDNAVRDEIAKLNLPKDEADSLFELRREKLLGIMDKWIEYQEYVHIEFDTDANTATVKKV